MISVNRVTSVGLWYISPAGGQQIIGYIWLGVSLCIFLINRQSNKQEFNLRSTQRSTMLQAVCSHVPVNSYLLVGEPIHYKRKQMSALPAKSLSCILGTIPHAQGGFC